MMNSSERSILQPGVFIPFILVSLIWGSTWLVITGQLGGVPPTWSVAYRFAIGAAVMFVYTRFAVGTVRLDWQGHIFALLFGVLQFCLNFNGVYLAEQYVTSGLVAVVFSLLIVPNSLLAWLFLKHRITRRFLLGSLVSIIGVGLLFMRELSGGVGASEGILIGIALTLVGVLSASAANVMQAMDRIRDHSLPALTAWGMAYGALANAAVALLVYGGPVVDPRPSYWAGLIYLGVVASAIAFSLYFPLVRSIGPARAAYTSLIIPVIAMLLSSLFEDYVWTPAAAIGGLLTLGGLFIALRSGRGRTEIQTAGTN